VDLVIEIDDPRAPDVAALIATHRAFAKQTTPREYSFALDIDQLAEPGVTFFSARRDGQVIGIAALKRLDATHAELKSMHTREAERGKGVGKELVGHVLAHARDNGYERISLETGSTEEFEAAQTLYTKAGFTPCPPFGDYAASPYNTFMTIRL
jgi:putative acetyltransferase